MMMTTKAVYKEAIKLIQERNWQKMAYEPGSREYANKPSDQEVAIFNHLILLDLNFIYSTKLELFAPSIDNEMSEKWLFKRL